MWQCSRSVRCFKAFFGPNATVARYFPPLCARGLIPRGTSGAPSRFASKGARGGDAVRPQHHASLRRFSLLSSIRPSFPPPRRARPDACRGPARQILKTRRSKALLNKRVLDAAASPGP
ncbi:hypothetical protein PUN28_004169 [Cardiocondyla obscurior]|uniref:Uncharacterized protein n=1 Tax=Cardiocondyla obscurior TaxID=286306 RepID=A0AAW2GPW0_9HYME